MVDLVARALDHAKAQSALTRRVAHRLDWPGARPDPASTLTAGKPALGAVPRESEPRTMSMIEWKFQGRQAVCSACEAAYAEGQRHVSLLSIAGEELVREDVCLSCWEKRTPAQDLFFWFTRHHADRRRLQLDLSTLEQLFIQLEGRGERQVRELRYVLCLLLMRKRRLKLVRVARGAEGESLIVKRPRRTEGHEVLVFDFAPERVDELRQELVQIFEGSEPGQWAKSALSAPPSLAASGGEA